MVLVTGLDLNLVGDGVTNDGSRLQSLLDSYRYANEIVMIVLDSKDGYYINNTIKIPSNIHLRCIAPIYFGKYGTFNIFGETRSLPKSGAPYLLSDIISSNKILVSNCELFSIGDTIEIYSSPKIRSIITEINNNILTLDDIINDIKLSDYTKNISVYIEVYHTVVEDVLPMSNKIKLQYINNINEFDYIRVSDTRLCSDTAGTSSNRVNIEITQVTAIDRVNNIISVSNNLVNIYSINYSAFIEVLEPVVNSSIEGVRIHYRERSSSRNYHGIKLVYSVNCNITNCHIVRGLYGNLGHAFHISDSFNSVIINCSSNNPMYTGSGEGYGFCLNRSSFCRILNCIANGDRHGYLIQASNNCILGSSHCLNDKSSGIDIHGINSQYNLITDCLIAGGEDNATNTSSRTGIKIGNTSHFHGDHNNIIQNCIIQNYKGRAIEILQPCSNNIIRNCTIKNVELGVRMGQLSNAPHLVQDGNIIQSCTFNKVDSVYYINQYTKINNGIETITNLVLHNNLCLNVTNDNTIKNISLGNIKSSDIYL
jgi:parallel beta-helix repeat protein